MMHTAVMDKAAVAQVLEQIAAMMELVGENPFRVRAFRTAARALGGLHGEIAPALADGTVASMSGIGPAILQIVTDLVGTGNSRVLEELRERVPPGLVEMLGIPGLGVSRIRQIHDLLDIDSLPELEAAARSGRLSEIPGFGPKTCENVLKGIAFLRRASEFRLLHHARVEMDRLVGMLEEVPGVLRAIPAGEVRRWSEVVRDLVVVLVTDSVPEEVLRALGEVPGISEYAEHDERVATIRVAGGSAARVIVTPPVNLGAVLVQATGSEGHVDELGTVAADRGSSLRGGALWQGSTFIPTPDEATLYRHLGLPEIPPELREGRGETRRYAGGVPMLVTEKDILGLLHCHTTYSDGTTSAEELALACREAGYQYVGITDHSQSAAYAGGIRTEDLPAQWAEIDEANTRLEGIRILKGIEADILPDGGLDYDNATLAGFDFVIASVHSRFGLDATAMTARVLAAIDNPYVAILGHPSGRLLLSRDPYPLDFPAIFARAAARGVAIEINADPHRLDLDWRLLGQAREAGVMISLGADAHSPAGLEHMRYGVAMARKGGLGPGDILNTRPVEAFLAFARARRPE